MVKETEYDEEDDSFFEYFSNRPIGFVVYLTLSLIISFFGIFGNVILIYTKLRRFSILKGLELLVINLACAIIVLSLISLLVLSDDVYHELTDENLCNLKWFMQGLAMTSNGFSAIALIIASKYFSKISRQKALIIILFIWIAAVIDAYPYYKFEASPISMSSGIERNICHLAIKYFDDIGAFLNHQQIMMIFEFIIPSFLLITISCISLLWKKPDASTNQVIFMYSLAITFYYTLVNSPLVINRFMSARNLGSISNSTRYFLRFCLNFAVVANVIFYGYFDNFFVKELLQILRIGTSEIIYEQQDEKNEEEV